MVKNKLDHLKNYSRIRFFLPSFFSFIFFQYIFRYFSNFHFFTVVFRLLFSGSLDLLWIRLMSCIMLWIRLTLCIRAAFHVDSCLQAFTINFDAVCLHTDICSSWCGFHVVVVLCPPLISALRPQLSTLTTAAVVTYRPVPLLIIVDYYCLLSVTCRRSVDS